ncbi:galaxin-like isoform X2 [Labeo rohita]|uniref:galaxin-like isoform X2 n=1 Tax=Labeo rohita TaxID=84645 RepID=UPI0021E1D7BD|nr:galaxin-like isoform X2 [Labeo rohita]
MSVSCFIGWEHTMEIYTSNAFLLAILCVFAALSGQGNVPKGLSQLETDYCNSSAYNPVNQICCNGSIHNRSSAHSKCCGQVMYVPTAHICCGNNQMFEVQENLSCCGNKSFDTTRQHCCVTSNTLEVRLKNECPSPPPKDAEPSKYVNCSGKLYKRESGLTRCCGKDVYSVADDNVLCCNGVLYRNVPEDSECVGGVIYDQNQIKMLSCGSEVYDHKKQLCCSGQLYSKTEAECCGNLLLESNKNQICCSSSTHAKLYDIKHKHFCCGHYYYNTSLWSCCAEHLKPTPKNDSSPPKYRLKPLTDLIPEMCNKTVLFGKVESMVLRQKWRDIVLRVIVAVNEVSQGPLLNLSLNHCSSPALENGMTYLWKKIKRKYKPLSIPVDLTSDIHMFITVCDINQQSDNTCSHMFYAQSGFSMHGNF